jgi:dihydrofolate synthase/folylpolyglutamate synthase
MESYQRALDYLYSFINFEHKTLDRYQASKIDADRPRRLLDLLGAPQARFPAIHIAGTKGKGSVAAMCAACLREAGYRAGLYTSPHLREFRERIRILTPDDRDGRISEEAFVACMDHVRPAIEQTPGVTWFEIVTAIAFAHFAREGIDVGVIEVGLGGRLDATNVLTPEVSVITSLSLDHTQLLGDTLAQIAYEKGGIIKPGIPVVTAPQNPEALETLARIAAERGSPLTVVGRDWRYESLPGSGAVARHRLRVLAGADPAFIPAGTEFLVGLGGEHQVDNATVALAALERVRDRFAGLALPALQTGLATVQWEGRLQLLQSGPDRPTVLVDCAHNDDSAARLVEALTHDFHYRRLILVFGAPEDKNVAGMLARLLPLADAFIATTANHPRSASPELLAQMAGEYGRAAVLTHSVPEALDAALALAGPGDLVVAAGSIIVIGDLLNHWDTLQSSHTTYG